MIYPNHAMATENTIYGEDEGYVSGSDERRKPSSFEREKNDGIMILDDEDNSGSTILLNESIEEGGVNTTVKIKRHLTAEGILDDDNDLDNEDKTLMAMMKKRVMMTMVLRKRYTLKDGDKFAQEYIDQHHERLREISIYTIWMGPPNNPGGGNKLSKQKKISPQRITKKDHREKRKKEIPDHEVDISL